jgi:(4S)-4-hydroxy-5-phosphonooxypentane-2,3-dione isomerase
MLVVTVDFKAKSDKVEQFREAILYQARSSRENEVGCQQFDVVQSQEDPSRFFVYEIYRDEAAFEVHKGSEHSARTNIAVTGLLDERELTIWNKIDG